MPRKEDYIAVFDSGVGGISVLRELMKLMPGENYLYFGDSANAPYGDKSTEAVRQLTLQNAEMLLNRGVKALVIACNTATAAAIDLLRQQYPDRIILGIEPAVKPAVSQFPTGTIGIMATQVTLREEKLRNLISQFEGARIIPIPAPGLVELIEQGKTQSPETRALLQQFLTPYAGRLDGLVLGCTHYPFVKETVARLLGANTILFDGGEGTARQCLRVLTAADLLCGQAGSVTLENSLRTPEILTLSAQLLEL